MLSVNPWAKLDRFYRRKSASVVFRKPLAIRPQQPLISFTFDDFPQSALLAGGVLQREADDGLLSHDLAVAVPSTLQGLTTVFGMGTGVAPARWSPAIIVAVEQQKGGMLCLGRHREPQRNGERSNFTGD